MTRWRVGRSLGRTVYQQIGAEPSKDDVLLGLMETRELAEQVVSAVNERIHVEIEGALGEPTTCKVWFDDMLVFDGMDRASLFIRSSDATTD
jgi:hypothetical protein